MSKNNVSMANTAVLLTRLRDILVFLCKVTTFIYIFQIFLKILVKFKIWIWFFFFLYSILLLLTTMLWFLIPKFAQNTQRYVLPYLCFCAVLVCSSSIILHPHTVVNCKHYWYSSLPVLPTVAQADKTPFGEYSLPLLWTSFIRRAYLIRCRRVTIGTLMFPNF